MVERKSFFRNLFDALVEGRMRQAEHELAQARRNYKTDRERGPRF